MSPETNPPLDPICITCNTCVTDLQGTLTEGVFLNGWVYDNWPSNNLHIVNCSGPTILGGHNLLGPNVSARKNYTLGPHYKVTISVRVFFLDNLESNNNVIIYADNIVRINKSPNTTIGSANKCGEHWADYD